MAKKEKPKKEDLEQSFAVWDDALEGLKKKAEQSFMPLLAKTFELGQEALKIYKAAYMNLYDRQGEEE